MFRVGQGVTPPTFVKQIDPTFTAGARSLKTTSFCSDYPMVSPDVLWPRSENGASNPAREMGGGQGHRYDRGQFQGVVDALLVGELERLRLRRPCLVSSQKGFMRSSMVVAGASSSGYSLFRKTCDVIRLATPLV